MGKQIGQFFEGKDTGQEDGQKLLCSQTTAECVLEPEAKHALSVDVLRPS